MQQINIMADKISEITTNDIIIICFLVIAIFLILISPVKSLTLLYYIFLNFSTAIEFADVEFRNKFQMALWWVLDLYKRDTSRRGQAPAKQLT